MKRWMNSLEASKILGIPPNTVNDRGASGVYPRRPAPPGRRYKYEYLIPVGPETNEDLEALVRRVVAEVFWSALEKLEE